MKHYAGLDVSLKETSICILDEAGKICREIRVVLAREMAPYISPRPGSTPHPLTTRAADHMVDLVERASRFRSGEPS